LRRLLELNIGEAAERELSHLLDIDSHG
jgi:hypothetical protein